jgi:cytochrome c biogenesis protein
VFKRLWVLLTRMRVAVWLLLAMAVVCLVGSLLPQMPASARSDPDLRAIWLARAADKLGGRASAYHALGWFDIFHSAWFYLPLGLLMLNALICTLNRLRRLWKTLTQPRIDLPEALAERLPQQARFDASSPESTLEIARRALRKSGFALRPANGSSGLYAERGRWGLLGTLFVHLGLLLFLVVIGVRAGWAWRDEAIILPPTQEVPISHGQDFALRSDGFEVDVYPNGAPSDYRAYVTVLEDGEVIRSAAVRVNHPLHYRGVTLYLYSVTGPADSPTVTLMAVHDPSYSIAIAAGILLLAGLLLAFYVPYNRIWARIGPEGAIALSGATNKLPYLFAQRFERVSGRVREALKEAGPS